MSIRIQNKFESQPTVVAGIGSTITNDGVDIDGLMDWLQEHYPDIAYCLHDIRALDPIDLEQRINALYACSDFSTEGRGAQWATTIDQHIDVRKAGAAALIAPLLEVASTRRTGETQPPVLLDVFGGGGFIAQFAQAVAGSAIKVITSDPSPLMVRHALEKNLPAFWQRAQDLMMTRSMSVDAVLFAYGTHHIPVEERAQSFREAWRVLKPGGMLLFHDFDDRSSTARWFEEVVDKYTYTGHQYEHFTITGVHDLYGATGFESQSVTFIDDCFALEAPTREGAIQKAIEFMFGAYGLDKIKLTPEGRGFLWDKISSIFSVAERIDETKPQSRSHVVIHRPAIFGIGRKPGKAAE